MARYLFVMWEGGGNVPVQLAVARRLAQRGHEVRVLGDPASRADVERAGCSFAPWKRAPHHNMRDQGADKVRDFEVKSPLAQFKRIATELFFGPAERYARDVVDETEAFGPDALAVDYLLFGAMTGAEKTGLPTAMLFHTIWTVSRDGVPPIGLGLRPARNALTRTRDRLLRAIVKRTFDFGTPILNQARASLGLPPLGHALEQMDKATVELVMTNRTFDFHLAELPPHVRYVGAEVDDPAWAAADWKRPDDTRPLVLVSLGSTFQGQAPTLRRIIAALGALPVRAIVTLGEQYAPGDFTPPENVEIVAKAPHQAILPHCAAAIVHGGHGSVMKALSHGVPLLCIPFGRDQADVAARAEAAGAARVLSRGASARRIRKACAQLLAEARFREGASRMQALISADIRADRAVAELEALTAPGAARGAASRPPPAASAASG